ncbi:hypothetical protein AB0E78_01415 [Streptomyces sp. NPDC032198]|uniref:hypothetical protein n=1 Tax=Streptomyces sp. NPDC032198 TaxID=3155127 RepID=UPI0033F61301
MPDAALAGRREDRVAVLADGRRVQEERGRAVEQRGEVRRFGGGVEARGPGWPRR